MTAPTVSAVPGVDHPEGRVVGEVEMPGPAGLAPAADMAQQAGALEGLACSRLLCTLGGAVWCSAL